MKRAENASRMIGDYFSMNQREGGGSMTNGSLWFALVAMVGLARRRHRNETP